MKTIAQPLLAWFDRHGRYDLPWKADKDAYRIWVSEVMLQQTQVKTVIPYYQTFMQCFPDLAALAAASEDEVLGLWSGLGYYSRARNLHKAAQQIQSTHGGQFPRDQQAVVALPGIGRSTAAAVLAMAFDRHEAILDGNVKRVLARYYVVEGWPGQTRVLNRLWELAEQNTPVQRVADYTQAIMDLGAMVCTRTRPDCAACPLNKDCQAYAQKETALYPAKRPAKIKPVKRVAMLLATMADGRVLLCKRPPTGIWASLWGLPEVEPEALSRDWCLQALGLRVGELLAGKTFRHTFSHYHLDIHPVTVEVLNEPSVVADSDDMFWLSPGGDFPGGIAAPVKRLLETAQTARSTNLV